VNGCLLDVNVLIALLWPPHEAHARTQRWFATNADQGWATCAMTQAGFVRIVSNPAFSRRVFLHEMRWKFCAPIFSIGRTGFGLTILGSQKRLLSSKGDSMVTSKSRTGICSLWRFTRREGWRLWIQGLRLCWRIRVTKRNIWCWCERRQNGHVQ